uniref:Moesin/ezrin/radixin homolog 1 n=1 Tax=Triatoma infestans TaxID=30076 RepID=A0A023F1K5_TRIIF
MFKFGSKSDINVGYKCTIRLLEDTDVLECEIHNADKGKNLLDNVCQQLNINEKDYFGLRYVDSAKQRHWLDLSKTVLKQIKDMDPILFNFRVKFYPPDPFKLKDQVTRYHIFLQLKRDLVHGRLYCSPSESTHLAAYVIQAEFGDYDENEHGDNYIATIKLLLKQTQQMEEKIMEVHQTEMKGLDPVAAENNFLRKAMALDTYGVDPHPVKDHKGNHLYLGINYQGILTFQGICKLHHFKWNEVHKLKFEGKMFIIHLIYREKKHTVGFKCPTVSACRHVWRCAIEQMLFFTLPSSSSIPSVITGGSIFSFGGKFRYSGRVEKEVLEESRDSQQPISRSNSLRVKASSVPDTPVTPINSDLDLCMQQQLNDSPVVTDLDLLYMDSENKEKSSNIHSSEVRCNFPEYYVQETLGHSYSESQLSRVSRIRASALTTHHGTPFVHAPPLPPPVPVASVSVSQPPPPSPSHHATGTTIISTPIPPTLPKNVVTSSKFKFMRVFWPSFVAAAVVVIIVMIILLETESEAFSAIREMPEMVSLRLHYYDHIKQFLKLHVSS